MNVPPKNFKIIECRCRYFLFVMESIHHWLTLTNLLIENIFFFLTNYKKKVMYPDSGTELSIFLTQSLIFKKNQILNWPLNKTFAIK